MQSQTNKPEHTPAGLNRAGFSRYSEVADYLGVHHVTLRRWAKNGQMPTPHQLNGLQLFKNSELMQWIESAKGGQKSC